MKFGVVFLALLALLKVGYQEYLARVSAHEIIVAAYRERAISACQRDSRGQQLASASAWSSPRSVKLVIGKSTLDVYVWQLDHAHWNARFKNPYLFVTTGEGAGRIHCEFDIVHGVASVMRM